MEVYEKEALQRSTYVEMIISMQRPTYFFS